jgi:hypothetical protein
MILKSVRLRNSVVWSDLNASTETSRGGIVSVAAAKDDSTASVDAEGCEVRGEAKGQRRQMENDATKIRGWVLTALLNTQTRIDRVSEMVELNCGTTQD